MMLKAEAEAGTMQSPRSKGSHRKQAGKADITVACAFDGFTWRLPRQPNKDSAKGKGHFAEDSKRLVWSDDNWVKQRCLIDVKDRR
jgi:hypothetical protein